MRVLTAFLLVILISASAFATPVTPGPALSCTIQIGENDPCTWWPMATPNGGDSWNYNGTWMENGWEVMVDIDADPDPFTDAFVSIKNTSGVTQTYIFTVTLPIAPSLSAPTLHGGSVAATLADSDFSGSATMAIVDQAMYVGQIDGIGVLSLLPPPVNALNVNIAGDSNSINANAGLPGPTLPSGAVITSIGIEHKFTLTTGDRGQFNSTFIVTPEPATICLLGLGGLLLRKRKS